MNQKMSPLHLLIVSLMIAVPAFSQTETAPDNTIDNLPVPEVISKPTKLDFSTILMKENQKRADYKEKYYVRTKNQKEDSVSKSQMYHKKGRTLFEAGDSKLAQRYYEKAISLNPFVDMYYYELAIACYRNGQHMKSLVFLDMVSGSGIDSTEMLYYEALNYMKMNEMDNAIRTFGYVMEKKDPELSPSAAMYRGLLLKQNKRYDDAKDSFQYVLDTAKDIKLDKKAEQQIDEILSLQRFEEEGKRRFSFSAFTGLMYDSNVLNVTNNNSSLNLEAYRLMYGGTLEYKAVHQRAHSLTPRLSASDLYSVDNSFKSNSTIQSTDPLQAEFSLPYTYRFSMFQRGSSLSLVPAYSNIFMSLTEQSRELVYSTLSMGTEWTSMPWEKWLNTIRLDVASDKFHPETAPLNDQTAMKYGLTISNMRLLDTIGRKTLSLDLNYIHNNADGSNSFYDRYLASIGTTLPAGQHWTAYGKFDYLKQDYSKSVSNRADTGFIVTAGGLYPITPKLNLNLYVQYFKNNSNVEMYDFNKITAMTMISYSSGFF